jgi:hypothetical protein
VKVHNESVFVKVSVNTAVHPLPVLSGWASCFPIPRPTERSIQHATNIPETRKIRLFIMVDTSTGIYQPSKIVWTGMVIDKAIYSIVFYDET